MRRILPFLALLFALPAAAQPAPAPAPAPTTATPRIGLVLGGGGARGFAHVGVLQVLEENRIPVHAVAGTSMGAVVGSLYASGKTPAQLTTITQEIPWTTIFSDEIPRDRRSFRRKRDERDVLIDFRISFDDKGLVLPKGVLRGQDLFLTLAEYLAPARGTQDFDDLAMPFRAVASDIETGRAVVMDSGDIATAVFASMAVPGGLPPVERDGKLLVDGFIADNLPIEVARTLGADHLIVVDVGSPLQTRDKISSFVSVLNQMQLLLGRESVERQLATLTAHDVLILPDQPDLGTTSFERSEDGIAAGRAAAQAALPALLRYQLSEAAWQAHVAARQARAPRYAPVLQFVKVENRSDLPDRAITDLVTAKPGQPLDAPQMTKDLQNVYALGGFRAVRYGVGPTPNKDGVGPTPNKDGVGPTPGKNSVGPGPDGLGDGVTITADGDPTSANWLQLGLGIATDFNRFSTVRIGAAYTDRNFLGSGLEWRSDLRVGTDLLIATGLYGEFGRASPLPGQSGRFFFEVTPYWARVDTNLYVDNQAVTEVRDSRIGARLEGGLLFSNWGELRLGANAANVDLTTTIGVPGFVDQTLQDFDLNLTFTADTLDNVRFPTSGLFSRARYVHHVTWLGGDLDYSVADFQLFKAFSWGLNTLVASGEIGFTSEGDGRSLGDFRLGGFLNLSGLDENQLIGRHKLLGRAIFYHRISAKSPIVDFPLYLGGSLEVGNTWVSLDEVSLGALRPAGSLFLGADTPLGPFIVAGGLTRGNGALYLILGRIF
jgi:NTE family protein